MKTALSLKDHWSRDPLLGSPWMHEKMGRDRWLAIHKALHFDILFIESIVQEQSHQHWIPSQKLSLGSHIPMVSRSTSLLMRITMSMTSGSIVAFSPVLLKLLLITADAY